MSKKPNKGIKKFIETEFNEAKKINNENLSLNDNFYEKLQFFLEKEFLERFQELEKKTIEKIEQKVFYENKINEIKSKARTPKSQLRKPIISVKVN